MRMPRTEKGYPLFQNQEEDYSCAVILKNRRKVKEMPVLFDMMNPVDDFIPRSGRRTGSGDSYFFIGLTLLFSSDTVFCYRQGTPLAGTDFVPRKVNNHGCTPHS